MGMAHLMGQFGLAPQPDIVFPLIQRAATLAPVQVPQPAYVYGLPPPRRILSRDRSPHSSVEQEAHLHLERAAFRACAVQARPCIRVCARTLPVPRPAERPILLARQSAGGSRGEHGAQQVVLVWGRA
jgi:hypothetical protein